MPNDRDEREDKPRFQIIDNRLLSDDERKGTAPLIEVPGQPRPDEERPKLEIIGGGSTSSSASATTTPAGTGTSALHEEPGEAVSAPIAAGDAADATETLPADFDDEEPISEAEMAQLQAQLEAEQFATLEQEVGRPLTEAEKNQVRQMMARQTESMSRLDVSPLLLQTISELPRYAAVHLGLVANPYTGLIARNDAEARLAIEAFGAMYDVLKSRVDARVGGELSRVLNDLRSNYTRITGTPIGPTGGPRIIR